MLFVFCIIFFLAFGITWPQSFFIEEENNMISFLWSWREEGHFFHRGDRYVSKVYLFQVEETISVKKVVVFLKKEYIRSISSTLLEGNFSSLSSSLPCWRGDTSHLHSGEGRFGFLCQINNYSDGLEFPNIETSNFSLEMIIIVICLIISI